MQECLHVTTNRSSENVYDYEINTEHFNFNLGNLLVFFFTRMRKNAGKSICCVGGIDT